MKLRYFLRPVTWLKCFSVGFNAERIWTHLIDFYSSMLCCVLIGFPVAC